jgi:hypothetical protein
MFSFGSIKLQSACNGAVTIIRDKMLHDQVEEIQNSYTTVLDTTEYRKKIQKMLMLKFALHYKAPLIAFIKYFEFQHLDGEDWTITMTRGFAPGGDFLEKFRVKPNAALYKNLFERLSKYNA